MTEKCDKCGKPISQERYQENDGVCPKCKKQSYPKNCFDPRRDNRSWWTDRQNSYASKYVPEKVRVLL